MEQLKSIMRKISSKPNLNKENVIDEVKVALQEKDPSTYRKWKEDKFNINHVFYEKATLLHFASENDNVEMVEALIENGADVGATDDREQTPL